MPKKITVYLGVSGAIGAIELEVPGLNDLYPINANIASNARGRRVEPGEYILDSIAYTPKTPEVQTAYGEAIIRFVGENENRLAIFGGETASDGGLAPTEGSSIRVGNDALSGIVNFIEDNSSETLLIVTDDEPDLINRFRSSKWYGQPANTERIGLIRPRRFQGKEVDQTFYTESGLDEFNLGDWLMWELLYNLDIVSARQTDFYQTYYESWIGYEDSVYGYDESADDSSRQEEAPYIADPFCDTEQQNPSFENQSLSPADAEIEPGDADGAVDIDDTPDNTY
jgi:hypothetical protein